MQVVKLTGQIDCQGYIHLKIPTELAPGIVDVVVVLNSLESEINKESQKKYDFSDLAGKSTWKGNAVVTQRQIRNEW